jgi:nitroreductase
VDFYQVIKSRRSIRAYKSDPIRDEILDKILDAGRLAPSAKNIQPWKFIVIKDSQIKLELVAACRNQEFIAQAPVIVCAVALEKIAWGRMGGYWSSYPVDLAIALEHIILAATNEGLGTCWIGAYDEAEVKRILKIPDDFKVIALTPIGYPNQTPAPKQTKNLAEIISEDKFQ